MRRDLERRLERTEIATAAISWVDRQEARHRERLRLLVKFYGLIRERLRAIGFDPDLAQTLRDEEAAAELAAIPDTPDLKAADEAILRAEPRQPGRRVHRFEAEIARIAELYRSGEHQLDLATARPIELFAFCVAVEREADELSASADDGQRLAMGIGDDPNPTVCKSCA